MDMSGTEVEFIVSCLRTAEDPAALSEVSVLASRRVNWPNVVAIARSHGILPLIRENLVRYAPSSMPASIISQLRQEFHSSAAQSLAFAHELKRISDCLERHGIHSIAFKGPALAHQILEKSSLRPCRDLDILIRANHLREAIEALHSIGYRLQCPSFRSSSDAFQLDKHVLLTADAPGAKVELHWSLTLPRYYLPVSFDELWIRRERISVLGTPVTVPGKEDHLLIVCFHAATHNWGSMKWLCDIAEFVRNCPELRWPVLISRARRLGCHRILLVGLTLARDVAAVRLPELATRNAARDSAVGRIRADVLARFSISALPLQCIERPLAHIRARERLRDRVRLFFQFITERIKPNERDREWIRLPHRLGFLYLIVRIVRVIWFRYNVSVIPLLKTLRSS